MHAVYELAHCTCTVERAISILDNWISTITFPTGAVIAANGVYTLSILHGRTQDYHTHQYLMNMHARVQHKLKMQPIKAAIRLYKCFFISV